MICCAAASSYCSARTRIPSPPPSSRPSSRQSIVLRQLISASVAFTIASSGNVHEVEAVENPSFSGVDPNKSELIQRLLAKTKEDKAMLDQKRLDNYYNKKFLINEITGKEILPNPCDPRDYEFGGKCRTLPTLPRLPDETLPEFPALVNNSSWAPPPQVEQQPVVGAEVEITTEDHENYSSSSEGTIEVADDEDVVNVVADE